MKKKTPIPFKAVIGYTDKKPMDVLARLNAIFAGLYADPTDYPTPPIDQVTFKSNIDIFAADITAALDGGAKAIAARDRQGTVVIKMLHELAHYVEANCKGDLPTFLKSGFEVASKQKTVVQPLSESIRNIKYGDNSGQFLVTIAAAAGAFSYELRWAPIVGGIVGQWTNMPVTKTRPATLVTGLTPGTTYAFQVRALIDGGYSDWSDSVTRISL